MVNGAGFEPAATGLKVRTPAVAKPIKSSTYNGSEPCVTPCVTPDDTKQALLKGLLQGLTKEEIITLLAESLKQA